MTGELKGNEEVDITCAKEIDLGICSQSTITKCGK